MPEETFHSFIQRWIAEYGTAGRLANAIGLTLSAFSRGVRNEGTLGVESCLRLAEETGESPGLVLRLAGKADVADLLERIYGRRQSLLRLGRQDRELLDLWSNLTAASQKSLLALMKDLGQSKLPGNGRTHAARRTRTRTLRATIGRESRGTSVGE
jgi:hypothetical protein